MQKEEDIIIDGMLRLKANLRRERKQKLFVLALGLGLTLGIAYTASYFEDGFALSFFVLFALVGLLGSLRFARDIWREWKPEQHPVFLRLHKESKHIVWVYSREPMRPLININFWPEQGLFLAFDSGETIDLRLRPQDLKPVYRALQLMLPHASFGYSSEKAQWYAANPLLLHKDEEERS